MRIVDGQPDICFLLLSHTGMHNNRRAALLLLRLAMLGLFTADLIFSITYKNTRHLPCGDSIEQSADLIEITPTIWEKFLHYRNSRIFLI
ncbi:hypothetical protein EBA31_14925 [Serratia sp. P2ACOL2]|nr:hypothetical protein EBA31_14925 [Serratia sp. P2ACOL2]